MTDAITLSAYAKINLYLDVTGKRNDGYHTIKSVMQSISLCDTVTISRNNNNIIRITCDDSSIPCDDTNIAVKAVRAFFDEASIAPFGVDIDIVKKIPSQAGLGGGSADGASAIIGVNELSGAGLTIKNLCAIGAKVGADVPFCITGGTVLCEGTGEILTPLKPLTDCFIVVGKGKQGISTKEAYAKIDMLTDGKDSAPDLPRIFCRGDISEVCSVCSNVFEHVSDIRQIIDIKSIMNDYGAEVSCMSGSGSAVFGIFTDRLSAEKCGTKLADNGLFSAICMPVKTGTMILNK